MKHATVETLAAVDSLLSELRGIEGLVERTPGAFYLKSKAFLHFHEDPSGTYADVKLNFAQFTRMRVTSIREQANFIASVRRCLSAGGAGKASRSRRGT